MNWQLLLTSALISGIVSSIIALYANERMKQVEFNFDFKKYVLQKRIATYELIEKLINSFFDEGEGDRYMNWFFSPNQNTKDSISEYLNQIHLINGKNVWLTKEIIPELTKIAIILKDRIKELEGEKEFAISVSEERKRIAFSFFTHQANLQKIYFNDVSNLNKVKSFLEMKNKHMDSIVNNVQTIIYEKVSKSNANTG
jgi:hypothetical protein